jgi:hypothetical protein
MRLIETVEVESNLTIVARERGKIVDRRDGHNVFLDLGREWLAELISYASFSPDTPERNDRVRYIGFGIGGTRQLALAVANSPPHSVSHPGTNAQTDLDSSVTGLERPVRVSGGATAYPGAAGDVWVGQVQAPALHPMPAHAEFRRLFTQTEVSYGTFLTVPLSEVALFTAAASPGLYNNTAVAYDTFDTISKTGAVELEVRWTLRIS